MSDIIATDITTPGSPSFRDAHCPSRQVLDRIGDRWTVLVLLLLSRGAMRYGELQRELSGISQKMLTQTLRAIERDGFATRTAYPEIPPRVVYGLTDLGHGLVEVLAPLNAWALEHIDDVGAARDDYDAGRAAEAPPAT